MRRRESAMLTPEAVRDLEALDRVLAGGAVDLEHADLEAIVTEVRADAPRIDPAFATRLEASVAEGFAGTRMRARARAWAGALSLRRHGLLAAGTALSAAVAAAIVVVAVGGGGSSAPVATPLSSHPNVQTTQGGVGRAPRPVPASPPSGGASATAAPGSGNELAPAPVRPTTTGGTRDVQRDASLTLVAAHGRVQSVADRVIGVTDRFGGIVETSNVNVDDQGGSQADFQLEVPAVKLDAALAAYSALAHVSSRNETAQDITDQTRAAVDRLNEARTERLALLRQLARATTPNQVASIHAQLGLVAGRISQDEQLLQSLRRRAQYVTVALTVSESRGAVGAGGGGWGPGDALDSAGDVLRATLGVLVVAAVSLVPLGLVAIPAWWFSATLRRRRREQALGPVV